MGANVRGSRLFFGICAVLGAAFLLALPLVVLSQQVAAPTEASTRGQELWSANNCAGCHTLYGQGAGFAPDLTRIASQRSPEYLNEFLFNPGAFHESSRIMPRLLITRSEREDLLAMLAWVNSTAANFPPGDLVVGGIPVVIEANPESAEIGVPDDPVEAGRYWFSRAPAICSTCHSLEAGVTIVGPSLAGIGSHADDRIEGMSAEQYIRSSILRPGDFIVPGFSNLMQQNFGDLLTAEQINALVAFLLAQTEGGSV